jgi:hypothetical protein
MVRLFKIPAISLMRNNIVNPLAQDRYNLEKFNPAFKPAYAVFAF